MLSCALLLAVSLHAAEPENSHAGPAPSTAGQNSVEAQRQNTLAEMWQRRILPPDAQRWTIEDMAMLGRLRRADASGAIGVLRRRLHGLKGLAVEFRPVGGLIVEWRLTREGFEKYLFLRSQDAIDYFDGKEIGAKTAFLLTDVDGHRLFDKNGLLTEAGEAVYNGVQAGVETRWKTPSGEVLGNRRHPPKAGKTP